MRIAEDFVAPLSVPAVLFDFSQNQLGFTRVFWKIENSKACCCDERCGSVEKQASGKQAAFFSSRWAVEFSAVFRKTHTILPRAPVHNFLSTIRSQLSHLLCTRSPHGTPCRLICAKRKLEHSDTRFPQTKTSRHLRIRR
jgi:hypothetical protein